MTVQGGTSLPLQPEAAAPPAACPDPNIAEVRAIEGLDGSGLRISVIIPVHEGRSTFRQCLQSIQRLNPAPAEVLVVVDGEGGGAAELAEAFGVRVIRMSAPAGPARARNLGALAARGDVLLFIDADVIIPPSAIGDVLPFFITHPRLSALIGSYDDAPAAGNFLSLYKNLFHHYVHQGAREEGYTFWGACGAIRREAFVDIGGFDEKYRRPCVEDIELGYRLKAAGHGIRMCKTLQVKHLKRWGAGSLLWTDFFYRALPWTELILRVGRLENDLNIDRASRVKVVVVYGLMGLVGLSWWWPASLLAAALLALILLALDWRLWRFFQKKQGTLFAVRTIPWHWFYYGYSGLAFAIGLLLYARRFRQAAPPSSVKLAVRTLPINGSVEI
jgi:glycosyltransferase involved in cell wall biosynthesis